MSQFHEKSELLRVPVNGKDPINGPKPSSSNGMLNGGAHHNAKSPPEVKNSSSGKRKSANPKRIVNPVDGPIPIVMTSDPELLDGNDPKLDLSGSLDLSWFMPQMNSTLKDVAEWMVKNSPSTSKKARKSSASDSGFDSSLAGVSMDDLLSAYNESMASLLLNQSTSSEPNRSSSTQSLPTSLKNSTMPSPEDLQKLLSVLSASTNDIPDFNNLSEELLVGLFTNGAFASTSKDPTSSLLPSTITPSMLEVQNTATNPTSVATNGVKPKKPTSTKTVKAFKEEQQQEKQERFVIVPDVKKEENEENIHLPNGPSEVEVPKKVQSRVIKKRRIDQDLPIKKAQEGTTEKSEEKSRPGSKLSDRTPPPGESFDIEEIEAFAQHFKKQRVKLGFTQGDVGAALGKRWGADFSQTTISRFEALNLSFKNMWKLRPLLRDWLIDAEKAIANGATVSEVLGSHQPDMANSSKVRSFSYAYLNNISSSKTSPSYHFSTSTHASAFSTDFVNSNHKESHILRRFLSLPSNISQISNGSSHANLVNFVNSSIVNSSEISFFASSSLLSQKSLKNSIFEPNSQGSIHSTPIPMYTSTPNFIFDTSHDLFLSKIKNFPFIDEMASNLSQFSERSSLLDLGLFQDRSDFSRSVWFSDELRISYPRRVTKRREESKPSRFSSAIKNLKKRFQKRKVPSEVLDKIPIYALGVLKNPKHPLNKLKDRCEAQAEVSESKNAIEIEEALETEPDEQYDSPKTEEPKDIPVQEFKNLFLVPEDEEEPNPTDNGAEEDDPDVNSWDNFQWNGQEKPSNVELGMDDTPRTFWNCDIWNNNKYNTGLTWRGLGGLMAYSKLKDQENYQDVGGEFTPWNESTWNSAQTGVLMAFTLDELLDEFDLFTAEDETDLVVLTRDKIPEI